MRIFVRFFFFLFISSVPQFVPKCDASFTLNFKFQSIFFFVMSLQNFSLPFAPAGYFEVNAASPQFYYRDTQNVPKLLQNPFQQPSIHSGQNSYRQPTHYTRVSSSTDTRNGKTSVHAVVDYDDDFNDAEYSQENEYNDVQNSIKQYPLPTVTPIQGPIFIKNGTVPVVPLYSYPKVNNGSFVQIPVSLSS